MVRSSKSSTGVRADTPDRKPIGKAAEKQRMLKQLVCSDAPEQALRYHGFVIIAGVDEVGRGALFGSVVAAAVILPEALDSLAKAGLKDSKQMRQKEREELDGMIRALALAVSSQRWMQRRSTGLTSTRRREWRCSGPYRDCPWSPTIC